MKSITKSLVRIRLLALAIAVVAGTLAQLQLGSAAVSPVPAGGTSATQTANLRTVDDPKHRFTIAVPATWHVQTSTGDPAVVASSPAPAGKLPDSVDVIVRDMPMQLTPEGCVKEAGRVLVYAIHSYTTLSQGPETIGTLPAYTHTYAWHTKTGEARRSLQVCTTIGRRAFVMIGTTNDSPEAVRQTMPVLTRIIETFRPAAAQPEVEQPPKPATHNR